MRITKARVSIVMGLVASLPGPRRWWARYQLNQSLELEMCTDRVEWGCMHCSDLDSTGQYLSHADGCGVAGTDELASSAQRQGEVQPQG